MAAIAGDPVWTATAPLPRADFSSNGFAPFAGWDGWHGLRHTRLLDPVTWASLDTIEAVRRLHQRSLGSAFRGAGAEAAGQLPREAETTEPDDAGARPETRPVGAEPLPPLAMQEAAAPERGTALQGTNEAGRNGKANDSINPSWSNEKMELTYGSDFSYKVRADANRLIAILDAFHTANWSGPVSNPFAAEDDSVFVDSVKYMKQLSQKNNWPFRFYRDNTRVGWRRES
jgi:hypothetical protein